MAKIISMYNFDPGVVVVKYFCVSVDGKGVRYVNDDVCVSVLVHYNTSVTVLGHYTCTCNYHL